MLMNNSKKIAVSLGAVFALGAGAAYAQSSGPVSPQYSIGSASQSSDEGPRGVQLREGLYAFPYVRLGVGSDDNLFLTNDNKKSSKFGLLNPGVTLEARRPSSIYRLGWDGNAVRYSSSSNDDYVDQRMFGTGDLVFTNSLGLHLGLGSNYLHDPRGSTDRPESNQPDRYRNDNANVIFALGANEAKGRFELAAGEDRRRYINNRAFTNVSDRNTDNVRGTFFWRVMPKTSILFEASEYSYDYTLDSVTQDSSEKRYFAGVTWQATALTSGTIKVGNLKKDFDSPERENFSGSAWEVSIQWKPMTYSKFDFFTTKTTNESTGVGDFILTKRSGVAWTHDWNSRLSSTALYSYTSDDFIGAGSDRKDTTDALGFRVNYRMGRGLTFGADYNFTNRDSNQSGFQYKRNQIMLSVGAAL
jgi:polysaccharide biosynthesis protein VpsM